MRDFFEKHQWQVPNLSALSYLIARFFNDSPRTIVLFAENMLKAEQHRDELNFFLQNKAKVTLFPDWETLPYDRFSPHEAIISDRILALKELHAGQKQIFIVPITSALHPVCAPEHILRHTFIFKVKDTIDREKLRNQLVHAGYHAVSQVMEHGEFAIRGAILDLFPMGSKVPLRLELFDDEIDSIRTFDPDTQRTLNKIDYVELLPAREYPLEESDITLFRQNWRDYFSGNPTQSTVYESISDGLPVAGIEYYLPLFFDKRYSLLDYLPEEALLIRPKLCDALIDHFYHDVMHRYDQLGHDIERPLIKPKDLFLESDKFFQTIQAYPSKRYDITSSEWLEPIPDIRITDKKENPLEKLLDYSRNQSKPVLIVAESLGRKEVLEELFTRHGVALVTIAADRFDSLDENRLYITTGQLLESFGDNIVYLSEQDLYRDQIFQRRKREKRRHDPEAIIRDLSELKIGDPVVHLQHGIGRYEGIANIEVDGIYNDFITLVYANEDKIYVPVTSLELISRFPTQDPQLVQLNRLGQDKWSKTKRKALEKIHDVAVELLELYARRESKIGYQYRLDESEYRSFISGFPFETTPDQLQAIDDVIGDMRSTQPMDRLVCGDVGFGKTEVAMRATFIAVHNNKQVAILAPTTLLAQQHYENFKDRFADSGANIEVISRFKSKAEQLVILEKLKEGRIDILIGTHKIIQKDITFKDIGLIIIDEEHRFGVKQKEVLKDYRSNVDILAMTATPIPRTLNMSLAGIRDISIIATPPEKRLAVKTFIQKESRGLIHESIQRELMRGGQVFYVHNDIDTIESIREKVHEIVPEAKAAVAHGQMRERQLEQIMSDFYHRRNNVLICTTIIENGIDIPTANTIIIDRADHFGLAQLHQLRGRVGRSSHQAYAYLIVPDEKRMTADGKRRIEAIQSMDELGSGFILATHDLEIRGAGELLGEEQSGHIESIGFSLYMELLEKTVENIRSGKTISIDRLESPETCEIDLKLSTIIPEAYIPNIQMRLNLYKQITYCKTSQDLDTLHVEFIDRFGLLPPPTRDLFRLSHLKLKAKNLGIRKIEYGDKSGIIDFNDKPDVSPEKLIRLLQSEPGVYRMKGPHKLILNKRFADGSAKLTFLEGLIDSIAA